MHIFDFNEILYGQEVAIEFYTFIRPEQRFDGLEALQSQISKDKEKIQQYFSDAVNGIAK